jgi:hypothetical protein
MRIDAIPVGRNPPNDVNVVIEVPIGGEPIKYEMDKAAGTLLDSCRGARCGASGRRGAGTPRPHGNYRV